MDINFFFKSFVGYNSYFENFNFVNSSSIKEEYLGVFMYVLIAFVLALLIVCLSYFLVTQRPETEKLSTYECGFEPYEDGRNKFHIRFYVVAILFILFDIEIIFFFALVCLIVSIKSFGFLVND
jgi:NADH-quinone oxidoreductase subunit A